MCHSSICNSVPALTLGGRWSESDTSFLYLNRSLSLSSCATRSSGRLCAATRPCGLDSVRPANITAGGIATVLTAHIQLSRRHFYGLAVVFQSIEISWHDDGTILRQVPHELLSLSYVCYPFSRASSCFSRLFCCQADGEFPFPYRASLQAGRREG